MISKMNKIFCAGAVVLSLVNCSNSDSTATTSTFSVVKQALENAAPNVDSTAMYMADPLAFHPRASVASALTTDNVFGDPDGGAFTNSLLEYVEKMYSDDVDNAVFSRANTPFLIVCTLDALAAKTGGIINNGTQTFTINTSQLSACGSADDYQGAGGSMNGETITAVISTPADTTYYDSYIIMSGASNPVFGGNDQFMYFRKTATSLNFAHYETDDSGSPTEISASWLTWDIATSTGAFQYISRNAYVENLFRIAYNPVDDDARVYTYVNNVAGPSIVATSAASTVASQTQAAFSFSWSGQSGGSSGTDANGCLNIGGLSSLATDNTLTCSGNSKTVMAASTAAPILTRALSTLSISDISAYGSNPATGDGILPDFDGTDITTSVSGW